MYYEITGGWKQPSCITSGKLRSVRVQLRAVRFSEIPPLRGLALSTRDNKCRSYARPSTSSMFNAESNRGL